MQLEKTCASCSNQRPYSHGQLVDNLDPFSQDWIENRLLIFCQVPSEVLPNLSFIDLNHSAPLLNLAWAPLSWTRRVCAIGHVVCIGTRSEAGSWLWKSFTFP